MYYPFAHVDAATCLHISLLFTPQVRPLRRQLGTLKAWITGQRKDQSPGTRMAVPVVEVDPVFEGVTGGPGSLIKYNPLSNVSSAEVWNFLRVMGVPTNKLHECGYVSIGCEPCTRPVLPNQHEREGRWWWEDATGEGPSALVMLTLLQPALRDMLCGHASWHCNLYRQDGSAGRSSRSSDAMLPQCHVDVAGLCMQALDLPNPCMNSTLTVHAMPCFALAAAPRQPRSAACTLAT